MLSRLWPKKQDTTTYTRECWRQQHNSTLQPNWPIANKYTWTGLLPRWIEANIILCRVLENNESCSLVCWSRTQRKTEHVWEKQFVKTYQCF